MRRGTGGAAIAVVLAIGLAGCSSGAVTRPIGSAVPSSSVVASVTPRGALEGPYDVVRVTDGDTIRVLIQGVSEPVRLIGIDTPETVKPNTPVQCFGPESSDRTKALVASGKVWLEFDPSQGQRDKYDRLLAYVWVNPTTMLNEVLVAEGYAREYTYADPYVYQDVFVAAQSAAQRAMLGRWSACAA